MGSVLKYGEFWGAIFEKSQAKEKSLSKRTTEQLPTVDLNMVISTTSGEQKINCYSTDRGKELFIQ